MKVLDIIKKTLISEEELEKGKRGIIFLDLDDTCLKDNISKIYRKLPTDSKEVALSTSDFAKEHVLPENKKYYDFRDFRDSKAVYNSIVNSPRLVHNLKAIDDFIRGGYEVGILTARGCENAIYSAVRDSFKYKDASGKLKSVKIRRSNVFAVNDKSKNYPGKTDYENKKMILQKYAHNNNYDYVYFIDDDKKNIKALKELKKNLPKNKAYKLRAITAKSGMKEETMFDKGLITEMAIKDLHTDNIIGDIKNGDYEKAAIKYVKIMRAQSDKDFPEFIQKLTTYGARTFRSAESKGLIPAGTGEKMVDTIRRVGPTVETPEEKEERLSNNRIKATKIKEKEIETKAKEQSMGTDEKKFNELEKGIKKLKDRISNIKEVSKNLTAYGVNTKLYDSESGLNTNVSKKMTSKRGEIILRKIDSLKRFIPPFIYDEKLNKEEKTDMEKADGLGETVKAATKLGIYLEKYIKFIQGVIYDFESSVEEMKDENSNISKDEMYKKISSPNYSFFDMKKYDSVIDFNKKRLKTISLEANLAKDKMGNSDEMASVSKISKEYFKEANDFVSAYKGPNFKAYVIKNAGNFTSELNNMFKAPSKKLDEAFVVKRKATLKPKVVLKPKAIEPEDTREAKILKPKTTDSEKKLSDFRTAIKPKATVVRKKLESLDDSEIFDKLPEELKVVANKRISNSTGNSAGDIAIIRNYVSSDSEENRKLVFDIIANIILSKLDVIDLIVRSKNIPRLQTQEDRDRFEDRKTKIITRASLKYRTDKDAHKDMKKYDDIYTGGEKGIQKEKWEEIRSWVNKIDFKELKSAGLLSVVANTLGWKYDRTKLTSEEIDELYKGISSVKGNMPSDIDKKKSNLMYILKQPKFSNKR